MSHRNSENTSDGKSLNIWEFYSEIQFLSDWRGFFYNQEISQKCSVKNVKTWRLLYFSSSLSLWQKFV